LGKVGSNKADLEGTAVGSAVQKTEPRLIPVPAKPAQAGNLQVGHQEAQRTITSVSPANSPKTMKSMDFEVKSFEEIMREKRRKMENEDGVKSEERSPKMLKSDRVIIQKATLPSPAKSAEVDSVKPPKPVIADPIVLRPAPEPTSVPMPASVPAPEPTGLVPTQNVTKPPPATPKNTEEFDDDDLDKHLAELEELINS
jgi:hypothetical protein